MVTAEPKQGEKRAEMKEHLGQIEWQGDATAAKKERTFKAANAQCTTLFN